MKNIIQARFEEHLAVANAVMQSDILEQIERIAAVVKTALANGKKVLFCGNGGSAADSQHLAAEFVGRFQKERQGLPAIALTVDTSILTAVSNDYGFDKVFARQVEALGNEGDALIGISTSGTSPNVIAAVELAKQKKGALIVIERDIKIQDIISTGIIMNSEMFFAQNIVFI